PASAAPDLASLLGWPPDSAPPQQIFVKVVNRSRGDVEITHIWFATTPEVHLLNKPLPARLRPDETYETWIPADELPQGTDLERLARVRLSTGRTIKSVHHKDVPPYGFVATGGSA